MFEIFIDDIGDDTVGIQPERTLKAELCENMVKQLKENNLLREFEQKLEKLVKEYYEPEVRYRTVNTDELDAEKAWYEKMYKENRND